MHNLRTILCQSILLVERAIVTCRSRGEGAGCDVVLEKLFVDDVDYGGDESSDVFRSRDESFNVACKSSKTGECAFEPLRV